MHSPLLLADTALHVCHFRFQRSYISSISGGSEEFSFSDSGLACLQLRLEVLPRKEKPWIEVLNCGHCISQVSRENQ